MIDQIFVVIDPFFCRHWSVFLSSLSVLNGCYAKAYLEVIKKNNNEKWKSDQQLPNSARDQQKRASLKWKVILSKNDIKRDIEYAK